MFKRTLAAFAVAAAITVVATAASAFTLTVNPLSDYAAYFGKADVPSSYGGSATTEKSINIVWSAEVSNGTWYINIDSQTPNDQDHQVDNGSGTYSGGGMTFPLKASDILSNANDPTPSGRKAIYVLLMADTSGLDGGSSTKQLQDNISPTFVYFKMDPPAGKPTITGIAAGDGNLRVSMDWWSGSTSDDKGGFLLGYRIKDSGNDYAWTGEITTTSYQIKGLQNLVVYEIVAKQVDKARNETDATDPVTASPIPVADYFTYYKLSDGDENGGFCFIATAAYGSPLHPFVGTLREFRDGFLMTNAPGRAFVDLYYSVSPPAAETIRHNPVLKFLAGTALLPAVALAWLLLHPSVPGLSIVLVGLFYGLTRMNRKRDGIGGAGRMLGLVLCAFAAISLLSSQAAAESKKNVQLEIKFGPYYPNHMDEEKGLKGQPYKSVFGYGLWLMTQIEVDYILYDKMGEVSLGGTVGFSQIQGKGIAYDPNTGTQYKSSDTSMLNIIPLQLNLCYRFDWFAQKKGVPLVPFVKLGLDYDIWWVMNGVGDVPRPSLGGKGYGGKWGWHATVGLAFLLDFIDPETANDLDVNTGINNTYLFAEWTISRVDNFNSAGFRLGAEWFMFGLMFEI